jgi:hypothetical protein
MLHGAMIREILILLLFPRVFSFGQVGHYVIGTLVYENLSEEVVNKIKECSYLDSFNGSMGDASNWADRIKGRGKYRWTSKLHYYDIDNDPPSYCGIMRLPDNKKSLNLMNGVNNALRNTSTGDSCGSFFHFNMLIHLLQDLHQPLHLTGKDRGGNDRNFKSGGKSYNLHRFWDSQAIHLAVSKKYPNPTLSQAVDFYRTLLTMIPIEEECDADPMKNVVRYATDVLERNCNFVWLTEKENYIQESTYIISHLVIKAIKRSVCILTNGGLARCSRREQSTSPPWCIRR